MKEKGKGWRNEPIKHALASKGIKTSSKGKKLTDESMKEVKSNWMKDAQKSIILETLGKQYNIDEYFWHDEDYMVSMLGKIDEGMYKKLRRSIRWKGTNEGVAYFKMSDKRLKSLLIEMGFEIYDMA